MLAGNTRSERRTEGERPNRATDWCCLICTHSVTCDTRAVESYLPLRNADVTAPNSRPGMDPDRPFDFPDPRAFFATALAIPIFRAIPAFFGADDTFRPPAVVRALLAATALARPARGFVFVDGRAADPAAARMDDPAVRFMPVETAALVFDTELRTADAPVETAARLDVTDLPPMDLPITDLLVRLAVLRTPRIDDFIFLIILYSFVEDGRTLNPTCSKIKSRLKILARGFSIC